jgi:hypothetical protein
MYAAHANDVQVELRWRGSSLVALLLAVRRHPLLAPVMRSRTAAARSMVVPHNTHAVQYWRGGRRGATCSAVRTADGL